MHTIKHSTTFTGSQQGQQITVMHEKPTLEWQMQLPPNPLKDFVAVYGQFKNTSAVPYNTIVVPDGRVDVIFLLQGSAFRCVLRGLDTGPGQGIIPPGAAYFSVNFKLPAVEHILGRHISTLLNSGEILPEGWWGITREDLLDFDVFCDKISAVLLPLIKPIDIRKKRLFELIYESDGTLPVKELSVQAGWSSRQMNRYFQDWFGLSLKAYCSIVRLGASFNHISKGKLFPELDYTDQNHFIKEIKKYTGVTPKELSRNQNDRFAIITALKKTSS
ncbi:helix-turn-helix domain-containing protein [Flavobacterium rhizosphaerae]|uniref:AraC family transcriptional regulator n=1 Tax=Flavobacterium rhizosphaerae TaxID=3163298 RepID=A0ABW8YSE9_9FLAO